MPSFLSLNTVTYEDVFLTNPSQEAVLFSSEIANLVKSANFATLLNNNSIPKEKLQPLDATNLLAYSLSGGYSPTSNRQIAYKTITSYNIANNAVGGLQGGTPVGAVITYYGQPPSEGGTVPEGYLQCDGSFVFVADYPQLFDAIDYRFGSDGETKFRLPTLTSPLSSIALIKY